MHESDAEVLELQGLLDRSMDSSGAHMLSIFGPESRLSARQVCDHLQGVRQVAAATTTATGEPMVAPIDAVFFKGGFYLSTDAGSVRARHLMRRPGISLTYFEGAAPVIIVHGRASFLVRSDQEFDILDAEWMRAYGKSITEISDGVRFIRVEPKKMFAFSLAPKVEEKKKEEGFLVEAMVTQPGLTKELERTRHPDALH